jgi:hypothetical protein
MCALGSAGAADTSGSPTPGCSDRTIRRRLADLTIRGTTRPVTLDLDVNGLIFYLTRAAWPT